MIRKNILVIVAASAAIIKAKKVIDNLSLYHNVEVIFTNAARQGYPLTKQIETIKLSKELVNFPDHIKWAKWADLIIVAPATANIIAKFYHSIADNMVSAVLLGARNPIIFVPAMNTYMYQKLLDRKIIFNLSQEGHMFIGPTSGKLKEGEWGLGRMVEPAEIVTKVQNYLYGFRGIALMPYGSGIVKIDPVRCLTNNSSGIMGKLLANELRLNGYKVLAVNIKHYSNKEFVNYVKTLQFDYYISVAAFADYNVTASSTKIKKNDLLKLILKPNLDVLTAVKKIKPHSKIIAFKLDDSKEYALQKMVQLNLDMIIWNKLSAMNNFVSSGAIITPCHSTAFQKMSKSKLAALIAQHINKI